MFVRRLCLASLLATHFSGAIVMSAVPAFAQDSYPSRTVKLVAGVGPGGAPDIVARLVGQWLSERLGQTFVTENRPGAGGNIATEAVVRAAPDGYTLLMIAPSSAINATLYENLKFNFIRDIAPVASIFTSPEVLVVNPSVPAKSLVELIAYARSNPGKLNMASAGNGSGPHLSGALLMMMSNTNFTHVPYRSGSDALSALIAGRVDLTFVASGFAVEQIKAGNVRALGVTTEGRSQLLPDVPAIAEVLPGYESGTWFGIGAPKDTPASIIEKLNSEINAILGQPAVKARIAELDGWVLTGAPQAFGKLIADETEKKAKIIKAGGIKIE
jgi:tripartite-type tricarboxylate transporter receptor subunit TctC